MSKNLLTLPHPNPVTALEEYSSDHLGFMQRCTQEYEGIVPLKFDDQLFCVLTNPDYITQVLKDRLLFVKAKDLQVISGVLGNGLITSEGDFWLRQRRLAQPVFHQQQINSYAAVMVDYAEQMLKTWQGGEVKDIQAAMMRLSLNIVMKTLFNQDVMDTAAVSIDNALVETMNWFEYQAAKEVMSALSEIEELQQNTQEISEEEIERRYQKAIALFDETIYAIIKERRASGKTGKDLLGMLMQVEDADDGSRMTDKQLRDEAVTLILAGHETTANTLSWTFMQLAQNPDVREKLSAELKTVLNGRTPTLADLPQLTYTNWVIKESMRLYPPVTEISREVTQDCEIGGYFIPKGTNIMFSQWAMHRDARYFSAPELFQPERWANDLEKQLPRGVYFPFGDGPRVCIGKSFAMMEAVLLLATIAQKFQLDLVNEQNIELQISITLRARHGIQFLLKAVA
ncbi:MULTISPECIES: cytochrome P450 [unclassified Tolypothrix]|uniref:cytochrome P450 n=1 Tax=unclassified Tolypothrix TaxID=2649714 RepID=UPI0005F765C7|nr:MULTISPECIES: cytochrome P450 [unclassified Tolypothrix]MBE9085454.1 cytochrome P450 [Tolypothrix sp. LEGE 11397]UYD24948.1 cytochrome P450 [Tolypothrix sp. PCC 7712]UYD32818.1 cytochrome P450 [Tolypothrix sp. PCC 7601]BAY90819.1 cytochrome P450 [Microchaete diplosiphon NIES-3275]